MYGTMAILQRVYILIREIPNLLIIGADISNVNVQLKHTQLKHIPRRCLKHVHRAHVFHRDSSSGNLAHPLSASTRWQRRKLPLMKIPETQHSNNKVYTICNCPAGNQTAHNNGMQQTPMLHFRYGRWDVIIIYINSGGMRSPSSTQ